MKRIFKVVPALLLITAMLLSAFSWVTVSAATATTGYDSADDVKYVTSGKYVANWGARDEDCVFLSSYAQSFYTGSYTFDAMSQKSGGTTQSNASSSALYSALQSFMKSNHDYETSYSATTSLYKYTDCIMSNTSTISSFYSGKSVSGTWDSGKTWNREHTWPNSKGLNGNDENDIMMLRPTSVSENTSRGNTAYGESSSYYDPNKESNGAHNLHGDCARIVLYVYVRWGNVNNMWGSSGVIENLNVLLKWMEEDPVDTWEMGRNDAVQSITGTRNVFVDYPEYAWLLFGRDIPSNMVTPSGIASDGNAGGNTGGNSGSDTPSTPTTPTYTVVTTPETGVAYKLMTDHATVGKTLFLTGEVANAAYYFASTEDITGAADVYLDAVSGGYKIRVDASGVTKYITITQTTNGTKIYYNAGFVTSASDAKVFTWNTTHNTLTTVAEDGTTCYLGMYGTYETFSASKISYATNSGSFTSKLVKLNDEVGGEVTTTAPVVTEAPTEPETTAPSTPNTGVEVDATLSFSDKANRTEFTTSKQVWTQNGIILTNDKSASTNSVADYSNPARFYAGSSITIEAPGKITCIVIDCNSSTYANTMKSSISDVATVNSDKVTVNLTGTSDTYTVAKLTAQVRVDSITVTYLSGAVEDTTEAPTEAPTEPVEPEDTEPETEAPSNPGANIVFELGANGSASHSDGSSATSTYSQTVDGYTLNITQGTNMYPGARDAKGNSCIKLGTSSKSGSLSFTVPNDVTSVIIKIAQYKANASKITVNGTAYTLTQASNNGAYDEITVDTTTTKTVTLSTVSGGLRAMINSITFVIAATDPAPAPVVTEIKQMSVTIASNLYLIAHVTLADGESIGDYTVKFIHESGEEIIGAAYGNASNGIYTFYLDRIAPQAMTDLVTVQLIKGGVVVDTVENYSIREYAQSILSGNSSAEIKTLVSDMLAYGAAAQKHTEHKLDDLATDGVKGLTCSTATPSPTDNVNKGTQNSAKVDGLGFTSVGVRFDCNVSVYAKFTAKDLNGVTVTVNGKAAAIKSIGNGTYMVYSDSILATEFNETQTIVLSYKGVAYQTLTYSVNSYAAAKAASSELALALYRYGQSALAAK